LPVKPLKTNGAILRRSSNEETMQPTIITVYRGYTLTASERPNGGFHVEVGPIGSDRTTFTSTFAVLDDALTEARAIVDWQSREIH
jgi:hypothetical protein